MTGDGEALAALLRGAWRADAPPLTVDDATLASLMPLILDGGIAGLVWSRLARAATADGARATLRDAWRLQSLHALLHEERLARVAAAFARAGVTALLGKGWAVARHYPDPATRPYGDLDFYVAATDEAAAKAALARLDDPAPVDLHAGFGDVRGAPADVLARAQRVPLGDATVTLFTAEDHLRLIITHLLRHGACRPLWLCDVALAVENARAGFDWDYLLRPPLPLDWIAATLGLARALLDADLAHAPRAVAERPLPAWLLRATLAQWGRRGFVAQGQRQPIATLLTRPHRLLRALEQRWPNAIEASAGVGAPFDERPRLPIQLAECARRTLLFVLQRPTH